MEIANNTLKQRLQNVYFIWGSGKTTVANALGEKYGYFVYHTDYERARHCKSAAPAFQPAMCRDVPDYWALDPEDARQWEKDIVREFTPMVVADLIALAAKYDRVICEGDIDIDSVIPVVTNAVTISNCGPAYDFFDRPDQREMLDSIRNRTDLNDEEKAARIQNAYAIVGDGTTDIPRETQRYGVKQVIRGETSTVEETAGLVAEYFQWN